MGEQVYEPREYNSWLPNLFQSQICQFLSCLRAFFLPFPSTWITCLPINSLHFSSFSGNVTSSESIPDIGLLPTHFVALLGFLSLVWPCVCAVVTSSWGDQLPAHLLVSWHPWLFPPSSGKTGEGKKPTGTSRSFRSPRWALQVKIVPEGPLTWAIFSCKAGAILVKHHLVSVFLTSPLPFLSVLDCPP